MRINVDISIDDGNNGWVNQRDRRSLQNHVTKAVLEFAELRAVGVKSINFVKPTNRRSTPK